MMPVACNGKIEIGRSGECGDLICRGDVFLRDYATINGDVRTSGNITCQNNVTVTGNSLSKINIPSSELPLAFPAMDNPVYSAAEMANNVNLEPGTECELPPGNYGNYYAKRDTKLKLCSGVYYFNEIDMGVASASLILDEEDGPVEIYIKSHFRMRGTIEHSRSGIDGARNFMVVCYGDRTVDLNCGFSGTIVAPNANLIMAQTEKYYEGSFYAKSIEIHQDAIIKYIPYAY